MVKDYHPTPDIREFEETRAIAVGGRALTLHLSAIDYGTHTGAVFRVREAESGDEIVSVPIEAHWHQRGRYLLQVGPSKSGADTGLADQIGELAGSCVASAVVTAQARAKSRPDMFDELKAAAAIVLDSIEGALT